MAAMRREVMRSVREVLDGLDAASEVHPRVTPSLGPHAVYTVSPETLTWIGDVVA